MTNFEPFSKETLHVIPGGRDPLFHGNSEGSPFPEHVCTAPTELPKSLFPPNRPAKRLAPSRADVPRIHPEYDPTAPKVSSETLAERLVNPLFALAERAIDYAVRTRPSPSTPPALPAGVISIDRQGRQ